MPPSHTTDEQLLAALRALGIDVSDDLGHSSHDTELRTAALWALLWRSAGAGYEESVAGPGATHAPTSPAPGSGPWPRTRSGVPGSNSASPVTGWTPSP
ncbi:hypothetical protein [Streptomyces sp. NPDC090131]|uniref:hypothetical protein n=1 Tax=Streptomyces sp. NPDC090131 TaxID=3365954 RepID=UPI0037F86A0C